MNKKIGAIDKIPLFLSKLFSTFIKGLMVCLKKPCSFQSFQELVKQPHKKRNGMLYFQGFFWLSLSLSSYLVMGVDDKEGPDESVHRATSEEMGVEAKEGKKEDIEEEVASQSASQGESEADKISLMDLLLFQDAMPPYQFNAYMQALLLKGKISEEDAATIAAIASEESHKTSSDDEWDWNEDDENFGWKVEDMRLFDSKQEPSSDNNNPNIIIRERSNEPESSNRLKAADREENEKFTFPFSVRDLNSSKPISNLRKPIRKEDGYIFFNDKDFFRGDSSNLKK